MEAPKTIDNSVNKMVDEDYKIAFSLHRGKGVDKSHWKAFDSLQKAAKNGSPEAYALLGEYYMVGYNAAQIDLNLAFKYFKMGAELGNADAQCHVAFCYKDGEGTPIDKVEAIKWINAAAAQNHPYSIVQSYYLKINPTITEQVAKTALSQLESLALDGDPCAMFRMSVCYLQGKATPVDQVKAVEWLRRAAEEDHALALNNLGMRYVKGEGGLEVNFQKAIEYFRRAAMQGNSNAQNNIAIRFLRGEGERVNATVAEEWLVKAAQRGNVSAQMNLADCYRFGDRVNKSMRKALRWFQEAAKNGSDVAKSQMQSAEFVKEYDAEVAELNQRWKTIRLLFLAIRKNEPSSCAMSVLTNDLLKALNKFLW